VQNVLEMLEVPYVGTDPRCRRRRGQADRKKAELARAGLATPYWWSARSTFRELGAQGVLDAMVDRLRAAADAQADQGGSALGAQVVRSATDCRLPWSARSRTATTVWRTVRCPASRWRSR